MPRSIGLRVATAVSLALAAGCQLLGGFQTFAGADAGLDGGHSDASPADASVVPCPPLPASKIDPIRGVELRSTMASGGANNGCSWIDQTEVTVQQYSNWLIQNPHPAWDPMRCQWKGDGGATDPTAPGSACTIPADEEDPFNSSLPVRCVDWCDALTFCTFYNARLCWSGGFDVSLATSKIDPGVLENDEWGGACAGAAGNIYPYGNTYDYGACRIGDAGNCLNYPDNIPTCGPLAPDTFPLCVSPVGAVDMIGNVREWVHYCDVNGDDTVCFARGGDWNDTSEFSCAYGSGAVGGSSVALRRNTPDAYTGFRCCADLTAYETESLGP